MAFGDGLPPAPWQPSQPTVASDASLRSA